MGDGTGSIAGGHPGVRAAVPARDLPADAVDREVEGGAGQKITVFHEYHFSIPMTLPTLNVMLRMHWSKRRRLQQTVSWEIMRALRLGGWNPSRPLNRCDVEIVRHSRREPDRDGLASTAKLILDALQPASKTHPCGLGVIREDDSTCIRHLDVRHATSVGRKVERTDIIIREVRDGPVSAR
jgi:hypothetical protein